jgi:predicted proteasome-type protease
MIPHSEKLIYVPISVYSACSFAESISQIPYFIVGDAAYGVPYFKSLNSNLLCGT